MEKKVNYFKYVFLLCLTVSFVVQFVYIFSTELTLSLLQKIILIMIQMISIGGYTHFYLYQKDELVKQKVKLRVHWIVFMIYCFNLLYVLFLDPDFGRQAYHEAITFEEYWQYSVNLDLFETIQLFIKGYQNGVVSLETLLRNLLGNLLVFMPMAYFLPRLFHKQNHFGWFLMTMFLSVLSVEVMQVFLRIGSGDIDDLFLNVLGAVMMYLVLKFVLKGSKDKL